MARLLIALAALAAPESAPSPPLTNIVVFLLDTVRPDRLHSYGGPAATAPVFDRIASQHFLFENAYAPSPWTRPSVASLFTGLYPRRHGVEMRRDVLPNDAPTLSEILQRNGFQTVMINTNPHLTSTWGMARGFTKRIHLMPDAHEFKAGNAADVVSRAFGQVTTGLVEPFFVYVHLIDPHWPYDPPRQDLAAVGATGKMASYDGEIHFADRNVGIMLDSLERAGLLARTIVVLTSDHGEEFSEHGSTGHGKTLYQEVVRIPLAMQLPAQLGAQHAPAKCGRIRSNVSLVDVAPTLLSLIGIRHAAEYDGADLAPLLRCAPDSDEPRPLFFSVDKERASLAAVLLGNTKLIVDRASGKRALYALAGDPQERRPVSGVAQEVEEHLAEILSSFEASAQPGIHLELAGRAVARDRRHMVVTLETDGRFVRLKTQGFEPTDKARLSEDGKRLLVDTQLLARFHHSPKHVWVQDRDTVSFELEPPTSSLTLDTTLNGRTPSTAIVRTPKVEQESWPLSYTRAGLLEQAGRVLIDRRLAGVYLYARHNPQRLETIPPESMTALRALGYVQ